MKRNLFDVKALLLALSVVLSIATATALAQNNKPTVSKEEGAAAEKVQKAADIPAKFLAAEEFVKKYPNSTLRLGIAQHIADQIKAIKEPAKQVAFSEQFFNIFNEEKETDEIIPTLIYSYLETKKYDEAFQSSEAYLSRHPESLPMFVELAIQGSNLAKQQNAKFATQSLDYTNKAIAIIESNKKPATVNDAAWEAYKTKELPKLYHSAGFLLFASNNSAEAKAKFEKAIAIDSSDPLNYYFLGNMAENEYQATAKAYQAATGKTRDDLLAKAMTQLDVVIDHYAHALAIAEGKPEYQAFSGQLRSVVEPYYKFRYKDKPDGLQDLINKYKTPAKP